MNLESVLQSVQVDQAIRAAYPDYVVTLVSATGLNPGPSTAASEALLARAELDARATIGEGKPEDLPEVQAWRAAYLSFGVKPRDGRSSVEALLRRVDAGLPRIDRLTDTYNALSVLHRMPVGGEDLAHYVGAARLVIATGSETFDTVADGQPVSVNVEPGEVVWRDDIGVTCRRWNWRQCVRTRLTHETTDALFIIDGLGPGAREKGAALAAEQIEHLRHDSPAAQFSTVCM